MLEFLLMDTFLLTFHNPQLEGEYDRYLLNEGQWTNDKSVYGFISLGNVLSVARLLGNKEGDLLLLLPQLLGWVVISTAFLYRTQVLKITGVPAWRTEAVIMSRYAREMQGLGRDIEVVGMIKAVGRVGI